MADQDSGDAAFCYSRSSMVAEAEKRKMKHKLVAPELPSAYCFGSADAPGLRFPWHECLKADLLNVPV
jgi:hypothetical protein